ncbi:MAG: nitroreductase family protein [Azospirillum sp.]|nr:nitroreductase family protein [Azospirillum sp.]
MSEAFAAATRARFGEDIPLPDGTANADWLARMAARRAMRAYADRPVDDALILALCAAALAAPSKSDLQQADILRVRDPDKRAKLAAWAGDNPWVGAAPVFLVFLANGRRQPVLHELRGRPFANDHLDAFFNASVDAGIALATFVAAADAAGLGTCPISVIRNRIADVAALLDLPPRVFPVAGLCVGWPAHPGAISPRLPTALTVHEDRYDEGDLPAAIAAYDARRNLTRPFAKQRDLARFGASAEYGWSEDKARQYAVPERADFGAFVRKIGFKLD